MPDLLRAKAIFIDAQTHPPAERADVVASAAPDDPALQQLVLDMLREDDIIELDDRPPALVEIGDRYTVLSKYASGTYGTVYLATQHHPERTVAIKVLARYDDTNVARRFRIEQQTLARMNHPSIATVLDSGQSRDGRPYFAMPFIRGGTITAYCDEMRLTIDEREML